MSENQHIEDLDVESGDADAVVGGRMSFKQEEAKLKKEGWVAKECVEGGGTLMENIHSGAKKVFNI